MSKDRLKHRKQFLDYEKELAYINEMNRLGWKLERVKHGRVYEFVKTEPEEYVRYWRRNVPSRRTNWLDVRHNVIVSNRRSSPKSPTYMFDGVVRMLMSSVSPSCGKASPVQFDATFM